MITSKTLSRSLRGGVALHALVLFGAGVPAALFAAPAFAQETPAPTTAPDTPQPQAAQPAAQDQSSPDKDIVITGSLIRNRQAESASPLVTLSSDDLEKRGINTVAEALQQLSANNAGTVPPSWTAFGFATGASTPSLRGFNNAFTLTMFDGLRSAAYPLADDGYRNFVDINTIPDSIVDRIDVLQDGASAIYGSDAVAGVVNVLVKKEITGLHLNASAGISQRGDGGERRIDATYGFGKLDENGFNIYVNGEYQVDDALYLRDRGFPFNTADQSSICTGGGAAQTCGVNGVRNGIQADGSYSGFQTTIVPYVRAYDATATTPVGRYQQLNPALGCYSLPSATLTAAQLAANVASTPTTVCQQDSTALYSMYNAPTQRLGGTVRGTVKLGSDIQAYAMFNYYRVKTQSSTTPDAYANLTANVGTEDQVLVSPIFLPVYVCSAGVGTVAPSGVATSSGCTAANGALNPNNPFAANNQQARLAGMYDRPRTSFTNAQTYRISGGISGSFGDGFKFNVEGTHSWIDLDVTQQNYIEAQDLLNAIAQGTFNFVDLSQNTEAQRQAIAPTVYTRSTSSLTQFQGSIQKDLVTLPGGPLTAAAGLGWRRESIDAPSANPSNPANPVDRYYTINAVSTNGSRSVFSAFGQINAPILPSLTLSASGRYDKYSLSYSSHGFDYFAPKLEAKFAPFKQLQFRGTYSKGFAVPSISEATATSTGFVTTTIDCSKYAAFCAAHASNPAYYQGLVGYGFTSVANPDLKPQKSRSFTGGVVLQPTRQITLTVDYWNTKIDNYIVSLNTQALAKYYANNGGTCDANGVCDVGIPGVSVIQGVPDDNNPNALPLASTVVNPYANAASLLGSGVDITATARVPLGGRLRWTVSGSASYLDKLQLTDATGAVQKWAGSLSPCNITSCSGAPRWRASLANTLEIQDLLSLTLTAYYTSGYKLEATDLGGVYGDCQASIGAAVVTYADGVTPIKCSTKGTFDLDANVSFKVNKRFTFYINALNILDIKPPYDPSAGYSLYNFNPAWADSNFMGRYFRAGAKVDF